MALREPSDSSASSASPAASSATRSGRPPVHLSMAEAARIGIMVILVASVVFLAVDSPTSPAPRVFALHYAGRTVASLVALAAVRLWPRPMQVAWTLWALAAVVSASSATLGIVRGDFMSNAMISVAISVGSAAIIPWNWKQHLVLATIFLAGVIVDAAAIGGSLRAAFNIHVILTLVVCLGGATYTVAALDRVRRAIDQRQREDEAAIAALTAELESRVAARTEELGASNADLRTANAELGKANAELQGFTYSVSHDLRGALRVLGGQSHMLLEDHSASLPEAARHLAVQIREGTIRIGQLVDALLSLARVSRIALRVEPVDLSQLASEVGSLLADAEPERRVLLSIEPGLVASGDPSLLRILLENLLSNAWKFTRRRPDARIEIGAREIDEGREFFVRDNGAGFDMRFAGKLFRPFERLHEQGDFEGTGIGLATVHRVIVRHGGRIRAEGSAGAGAEFAFTLPADAPPAAAIDDGAEHAA
ncbi:MAG TPA: ATP-binding protein [Candidatus Binatia bacterium]|jgi:signal transduction histidine kinase